ncbi:MAG: hypothetical protein MPL62_11660 [Alphaproteobacteria bacterium]|nr:hypothetical protein [Alphaproteobacteria bacterium]
MVEKPKKSATRDQLFEYIDRLHDEIEGMRTAYREAMDLKEILTQENFVETLGKVKDAATEYKTLHDQTETLRQGVEDELAYVATTIGLAGVYNKKAESFADAHRTLQTAMFRLYAFGFTALSAGGVFAFLRLTEDWSVQTLLSSFLPQIPVASIFVWLLIFVGNRRAETKKLEESYGHKAAMAQSYLGYDEFLSNRLGDQSELRKKLMDVLLDAIGKDSSEFLRVKGENHPAKDLVNTLEKVLTKLSKTKTGG